MKIEGKNYKTIWFNKNSKNVKIIDQTKLPHEFKIKELETVKDAINAIKVMEVRGAPLIGATAAFGIVLAIKENNDFIRLFTSGVRLVKSDKMSRIQIPKDLINYASINKDVILAAVGDIIEIWDKKQYEILIKNQSINFSNMAESVMGKINTNDEK